MFLGGAAVATTAALTAPSHEASFHQAPPITAAPGQYNPAPPRPESPAPIRLQIPSLKLSAPVEALGITQDFSLQAPTGISDVGWYRLGPSPGTPGDAVVSGHRGYPGGIPAVFNDIGRLHPGDEIDVQLSDGTTARFAVVQVVTTPYRSIPPGFFASEGRPRLTLVTCTGDFDSRQLTYHDRLVVQAVLIAANHKGDN